MERLLIVLKSYKRMPPELQQTLRDNIHPITVQKDDIIQPIGTITDNLYFIEKGLFQLYSKRNDGKQVTLRFLKEDEFIISLKELFRNAARHTTGIQALEDSIIWPIPGPLVTELLRKYHEFLLQYSAILTKDWIRVEDAASCSRPDSGSYNFDQLCELLPQLLNRVPIPYLANFTDIPEHIFRHLLSSKLKLTVSTTRRRKRKA